MKKLSKEYLNSLAVGVEFARGYTFKDATSDWNANEECATIAKLCSDVMNIMDVTANQVVPFVVNMAIVNGFTITPHGCDDYTRGFIAGENMGCHYVSNELDMYSIADRAEMIWEVDCGRRYGYYQDAVTEAIRDWRDK